MLDLQQTCLSYIDPGAGSLIVQILIASSLGALAVFRRAIFGFFGKKPPNDARQGVSNKSLGEKRDDKLD